MIRKNEKSDKYFCTECGEGLMWEEGYPDSWSEPGQDATWFCSECGIDYKDIPPPEGWEYKEAKDGTDE